MLCFLFVRDAYTILLSFTHPFECPVNAIETFDFVSNKRLRSILEARVTCAFVSVFAFVNADFTS